MTNIPLANRRFLVDVDDVLADLRPRVLDIVNKVSGKEYTHDDFTDWDYFRVLDNYQKYRAFQIMGARGFCSSLEVLPGAEEAISELKSIVKVIVVTCPFNSVWFEERYTWLEQKFGIPRKDVILASSKYSVAGKWFLDDNFDNILEWSEGNPCMIPMLWHTRATRDLGYDHLRVHSWDEVTQRVKSSL
jgi:5'(3')-deoxyribonucleotidase